MLPSYAKKPPGFLSENLTSLLPVVSDFTPLQAFNASKNELCDSASLNSPSIVTFLSMGSTVASTTFFCFNADFAGYWAINLSLESDLLIAESGRALDSG